jgi:hypothetical protein
MFPETPTELPFEPLQETPYSTETMVDEEREVVGLPLIVIELTMPS